MLKKVHRTLTALLAFFLAMMVTSIVLTFVITPFMIIAAFAYAVLSLEIALYFAVLKLGRLGIEHQLGVKR